VLTHFRSPGFLAQLHTVRLSICFLIVSFQVCAAFQAPKTWADWAAEGKTLIDAGDYWLAAQAFQQALAAAESCGIEDRQLAKLMGRIASAYADAGQYLEAEREWRHALAIIERTDGTESLGYALLMADIAVLPTQTGDREQTIAVIRRAIASNGRRGSLGELSWLRRCLGQLLMAQKKYEEAAAVLLDWQSDLARSKTPDALKLADLLNSVGRIRFHQGRFAEAVTSFRESLSAFEGAVGSEHPRLVTPLNNLATSLVRVGQLDQAGAVYQRAILICGKTLGRDHLICGVLLENYSLVLRKLGRKREAKEFAAQSRQIKLASGRRNGVGSVVSVESLQSGGR
jgi:tetratricopeptide (TPR) repeat protein